MVTRASGIGSIVESVAARVAPWLVFLGPIAVATVVMVVVWPGLMPDVGYWDTGEFQTILPTMGTAHPTGYPTYVLLGWFVNLMLAPFGEPAYRMNILSLLCVALAAGTTVHLVARLTRRTTIAMVVGVGVALAPSTWRLATHADPHTLHLALVAILFMVLVRWHQARAAQAPSADRWLGLAAVVFALAVGNHSLTLLLAVPVGLYVLSVEPRILTRPRFVAGLALILIGTMAAVYLELPLRAGPFRAPLVYAKPDTWGGFWYIALAEQFRGSVHDPLGDLPRKLSELATLAVNQFGLFAPLIPVAFLVTVMRHWRYALLTGSAMLITLTFNASYSNADISRYYLGPTLWAWTWLGVLATIVIDQVTGSEPGPMPGWAAGAIPDAARLGPEAASEAADNDPAMPDGLATFGRAALALLLAGVLLVPTVADFTHRARLADSSHDRAARQWVAAVLANVEPNAVVVSWWSTSTVLWYAQYVDHLRPDITVVDDRTRLDLNYGEATDVIARFLGSRPVYVIRANHHDLQLVRNIFELEQLADPATGDLYHVIGLRKAGG